MSIRDSFPQRLWSCVGSGCNRILPPAWVGRVTPAFAGKLRRGRPCAPSGCASARRTEDCPPHGQCLILSRRNICNFELRTVFNPLL